MTTPDDVVDLTLTEDEEDNATVDTTAAVVAAASSSNNNNDDDDEDDIDFDMKPAAAAAAAASSATAAAASGGGTNVTGLSSVKKRLKATPGTGNTHNNNHHRHHRKHKKPKIKIEKNDHGDDVIALDLSDDDDDAAAAVAAAAAAAKGTGDDEDIMEVADPRQISFTSPTAAAAAAAASAGTTASTSASAAAAGGDDIEVVGSKNEMHLPHARHDCTVKPFVSSQDAAQQHMSLVTRTQRNGETCPLCYCWVCDTPASQCTSWKTSTGSSQPHCHAAAEGPQAQYWSSLRNKAKQQKKRAATGGGSGGTGSTTGGSAAGTSGFASFSSIAAAAATAAAAAAAAASPPRIPDGKHLRQDCPVYAHNVAAYGAQQLRLNAKYCDDCVCFVCETSPEVCSAWNQWNQYSSHCCAGTTGGQAGQWIKLRTAAREEKALQGPWPSSSEVPRSLSAASLTKCRRCSWYNRTPPNNQFGGQFRQQSIVTASQLPKDWCGACGCIMSEKAFAKKTQSLALDPTKLSKVTSRYAYLGTRKLVFRLKTHDPRVMTKFQQHYQNNDGGEGGAAAAAAASSQWTFNQSSMDKDFFKHALGKRPTMDMLLSCISIVGEEHIPKDGSFDSPSMVSVSETDAIIFDDPSHLRVLLDLERFCTTSFAEETRDYANAAIGDIHAKWNSVERRGVLKLRVFVKRAPATTEVAPSSFTRFLSSWFGIPQIPLSEICGHYLHAKKDDAPTQSDLSRDGLSLFVAPFQLKQLARLQSLHKENAEATEPALAALKKSVDDKAASLSLKSKVAGQGGFCTNETDFAGTVKRYVRETLPDMLQRENSYSNNQILAERISAQLGSCVSFHRRQRRGGLARGADSFYDRRPEYDSFLSVDDLLVSRLLTSSGREIIDRCRSTPALLDHLENLGHQPAPFIEGLNVALLPFQSQSVQWAAERELIAGGVQALINPKLPKIPGASETSPDLYYNMILGKLSIHKPNIVRGGFIAEEMGLGKTVISLALILKNPAPPLPESGSAVTSLDPSTDTSSGGAFWDPAIYERTKGDNKKRGSIIGRGTLVVCPVSLVGQWVDEARSKLKNPGLVYSYHGQSRKRDAHVLAQAAIVVTTYETLASDATYHKSKSDDPEYCPPCEQVRWWRIICDESHVLRNSSTKKVGAVMDLAADNKWIVTGTPINTTMMDLANQLKFIGVQDVGSMLSLYSQSTFRAVNDSNARSGRRHRRYHYEAPAAVPNIGHFTFLMRSIMMRHAQKQKYRDTSTTLMSLPKKTERTVLVEWSDADDRKEYDVLEAKAKAWYENFKVRGHISKHYLKISARLKPLQMASSGGRIKIDDEKDEDNEDDEAADDEESSHEDDEEKGLKKKKKKEVHYSKHCFTSKLTALIKELERVRDADPMKKSLMFSQFDSTLKWPQAELPQHGFDFRTLNGGMTMTKRAKALRDFQNDPPTTIFLLSMRAGAVGINLTEANRVFIMEPCFNPALEAQAIGRVHRLGQKHQVEITRLLMKNSVETRIAQAVKKKFGGHASSSSSSASNSGSDANDDEDDGDKKPAAKVTGAPGLVGNINADKAIVVAAEFDLLFGVEKEDVTASGKNAAAAASSATSSNGDAAAATAAAASAAAAGNDDDDAKDFEDAMDWDDTVDWDDDESSMY